MKTQQKTFALIAVLLVVSAVGAAIDLSTDTDWAIDRERRIVVPHYGSLDAGNLRIIADQTCRYEQIWNAALANQGPFVGVIDDGKCSTSGTPWEVTAKLTTESGDVSRGDLWRVLGGDDVVNLGGAGVGYTRLEVYKTKTELPPFGKFTIRDNGVKTSDSTTRHQVEISVDGAKYTVLYRLKISGNTTDDLSMYADDSAKNGAFTTGGVTTLFGYSDDAICTKIGAASIHCYNRSMALASSDVAYAYGLYKKADGSRYDLANPSFIVSGTGSTWAVASRSGVFGNNSSWNTGDIVQQYTGVQKGRNLVYSSAGSGSLTDTNNVVVPFSAAQRFTLNIGGTALTMDYSGFGAGANFLNSGSAYSTIVDAVSVFDASNVEYYLQWTNREFTASAASSNVPADFGITMGDASRIPTNEPASSLETLIGVKPTVSPATPKIIAGKLVN
jgi:hypothetical protein